jgi:hypothetical protein
MGKPEGKRPLRKTRYRLVNNIKMDLRKIRWIYGLDWSRSGQGPVEGCSEHDIELSGLIKCWDFLTA